MLETDWAASWQRAFGVELRAEAMGFAGHGWPVLPGTNSAGANGYDLAPLRDDWQHRIGGTPDQLADSWPGETTTLLVATGTVLDAVEVPGSLGKQAACLLRRAGAPVPIVALPTGRWLFLTAPASSIHSVLAGRDDVRWHGAGGWIPLPPTACPDGVVHWRVKPEVCGWRLPNADRVHHLLAEAADQQGSARTEEAAPAEVMRPRALTFA